MNILSESRDCNVRAETHPRQTHQFLLTVHEDLTSGCDHERRSSFQSVTTTLWLMDQRDTLVVVSFLRNF